MTEEKDTGEQKAFTAGLGNPAIFGFSGNSGGIDRKEQLAWTQRGVALGYLLVPALHSAVDVISENLSTVPMVLKDSTGYAVKRSDSSSDSPFLSAIDNSYQWYREPLMKLWAIAYLLYGEVYVEKVFDLTGKGYSLKWLNTLAISREVYQSHKEMVIPTSQRMYEDRLRFRYSGRFGQTVYDEDEVVYTRKFNPFDDYAGYSDSLTALSKANIRIEFDNFTLAFYSNSGHPGVIVSPKNKLVGENNIALWRRQWQEEFRGATQFFKTHISSIPFDVESLPIPDVTKPLEVSKEAKTSLLESFRVSPEMIGNTSDNTFQFSKETKNAFMQTVVRPLGMSIAGAINSCKLPEQYGEPAGLRFGFDFSEFETVAKTDLDQQDVLERRVKSGGMSVGAYQKALGQEVVPGADDTYMVPQGFVLVKSEDLANAETPEPAAPKTGPAEATQSEQKPRETESETEDPESREFFGSKSLEKDPNFDLEGSQAMDTHERVESFRKQYFDAIPEKYDHINFRPPEDVIETMKSALQTNLSDFDRKRSLELSQKTVFEPDIIRKVNAYLEKTDDTDPAYNAWGGKSALTWTKSVVEEMVDADKKEAREEISILQLQEIATQKGISLFEALEILEEFEEGFAL